MEQLKTSLESSVKISKSFLTILQNLASKAVNSRGLSNDIGLILGRICQMQKNLVEHLKQISRLMLGSKTMEWKEILDKMERDHDKAFKKRKVLIKKKRESIAKLQKKLKMGKPEPELKKLCENMVKELETRAEMFAEQEKMSLVELASQERTRYLTLLATLTPILVEEKAMLSQANLLNGVIEKVDEIIADPLKILQTSENILTHFNNLVGPNVKQEQRSILKPLNSSEKANEENEHVTIARPCNLIVTSRPPLPQSKVGKASKQENTLIKTEDELRKRSSVVDGYSNNNNCFDKNQSEVKKKDSKVAKPPLCPVNPSKMRYKVVSPAAPITSSLLPPALSSKNTSDTQSSYHPPTSLPVPVYTMIPHYPESSISPQQLQPSLKCSRITSHNNANTKVNSSAIQTSRVSSPVGQPPTIRSIGDQTAKAALIRTLITERLNSCSPDLINT